jgi:hypothetical protein
VRLCSAYPRNEEEAGSRASRLLFAFAATSQTLEAALLGRSVAAAADLLHLIDGSRQQELRGFMHLSCSSGLSGGVPCRQMIW